MTSVVEKSADPAVVGNDEHSFEASVITSMGNLSLASPMASAATPTEELSPNSAVDETDGDAPNHSSSNSSSKNNHYPQQRSHLEDYRNRRAKLARSKQQKKGTQRFDTDNKNNLDGKKHPSRRKGRLKSNRHPQRVKMDGALVRKEMEEIHAVDQASKGKEDDSGRQDPSQESSKAEESSGNVQERSPKKSISNNKNTLTRHFTPLQQEPRQGRPRCSKSTNKSIDISSTTSTKKQSNSTVQKRLSVVDLVLKSPWAECVRNNSELYERRIRRARHHSKIDDHHPLTPTIDGSAKNRSARRSSSSDDVNADITRSDFGSRNRNRRKYRHSLNGHLDGLEPNTHTLKRLASSGPCSPKSPKSTADTSSAATEPALVMMTPYSVLKDPKYSYSDRVMMAAESNRTPMSSLKKYLRDEKELLAAAGVDTIFISGETKSTRRTPHRSKQMPHSLLQLPFYDGTTNAESSEKQGDDEGDNNKAALAVQVFGISVAKSMKKQAKDTKRKIDRQISKIASPQTVKSAYKYTSHIPLDDTATSESPFFVGHVCDPSHLHDDPMDSLKPQSGHCPRRETVFQAPTSNVTKYSVQRTNRYAPPSPLTLESESNDRQESAGLNVVGDPKEGIEKKSRKSIRSKVIRKSRQEWKTNPNEKDDAQLESSVKKSFVKANSDGDPSSSRGCNIQDSPIIESQSDEFLIFDDNDDGVDNEDVEEDPSIEGSVNINTSANQNEKLNEQLRPLIVDGVSTIYADGKEGSFQNIRDSSKQPDLSCTINKHLAPASPNTEPTTSTLNRSISFYDRCNSSSISTLVASVPTSPSGTRSKNNSEKSYSNLNQQNDNGIVPNFIANKEKNRKTSDHMEVPKEEETNEIEASNATNRSSIASQDQEISIKEVETKANNISSELVLNEEASKKKGDDDGLLQPTRNLEASKTNEGCKHQRTKESDVSSELFDLLKKEHKKENRAKLRKEATRERIERQKKELQRMRLKQHIIDTDIAVDSDHNLLDVSEISCTYHPSPEQRTSAKPRGSFTNESSSRNGQPRPVTTTKKIKSKNGRRRSKIKSRHEQDIRSKARTIAAASVVEQSIDPSDEEKNDSMGNTMGNIDEAASPI
jgi:hypothetical protein